MAATLRKPFNDNQHDVERRFAPRTIPDQVAEELGAEIVSGRRKAGERLVELDLARDFSVSRGPIREAIRILERRRLVDIFPRRGAYISRCHSNRWLTCLMSAPHCRCWQCAPWRPRRSASSTHWRAAAVKLAVAVEIDDPIAFAHTTTRAVKTIARGSGNELLVELLYRPCQSNRMGNHMEDAAGLSDPRHPPTQRRPNGVDVEGDPAAQAERCCHTSRSASGK